MWSFKFLVTKTYKQLYNNGIFWWKGLLSHLHAVCIFRFCIPCGCKLLPYAFYIQSVVRKPPLLTMYQCFLELVTCCLWCYSKCISTPGKLEKYAWPRWASCGYALRVTSQTSYSPEYIAPTQKKNHMVTCIIIFLSVKISVIN
jgi:hypothetical protein